MQISNFHALKIKKATVTAAYNGNRSKTLMAQRRDATEQSKMMADLNDQNVYATEDITFEDLVTEQGTDEDDGVEGRLGFLKRKSDKARVITPNPKFL